MKGPIGATFSGGWRFHIQRHFAGFALKYKHVSENAWTFVRYYDTQEAAIQEAERIAAELKYQLP